MRMNGSLKLKTVEGRGLLFEARVGEVAFPLDSGPGVIYPSPVQSVLAAIGACAGMDVISILRKKRQRVTAYEVAVSGERRDEHPRVFTRIEVVHRFRGHELSPAAIEDAIRLSDTKYCSVHASLRPDIEIVSRYEILPA
jgi:putative redox protein